MNNSALSTIVRMFGPTLNKFLDSGKVDQMIQDAKRKASDNVQLCDDESVEVMITTEADGKEYLSAVIMDNDRHIVKILYSSTLNEFIKILLKEAK